MGNLISSNTFHCRKHGSYFDLEGEGCPNCVEEKGKVMECPTSPDGYCDIGACVFCGEDVDGEATPATQRLKELEASLEQAVYEATHLSPERPDGSHKAIMSGAWLKRARAALKGKGEK